jgi:hypothetical protein
MGFTGVGRGEGGGDNVVFDPVAARGTGAARGICALE